MAYRSNRFARRARPYVGAARAVGTALKMGYKAYRRYSKYNKKKTGTTNTTTTQYDTTLQYRKKRMPKYKKRAWVKFTRKVNAVITKAHATQTVVLNQTAVRSLSAEDNGQSHIAALMYGKAGYYTPGGTSAEVGLNDLYQMCKDRDDDNRTWHYTSAVLDVTARNTGSTGLEVDLYFCSFGEDVLGARCLEDAIKDAEDETVTIAAQYSQVALNKRGTTLFDLPVLIKGHKIKIWSKRKYFLPQGATFTYQYRDPKYHKIPQSRVKEFIANGVIDNVNGHNSFVYPGLTKGCVIVFKKLPGETGSAQLQVGATRKYSYKNVSFEYEQDGYQG